MSQPMSQPMRQGNSAPAAAKARKNCVSGAD
jgi:hypothetical protein